MTADSLLIGQSVGADALWDALRDRHVRSGLTLGEEQGFREDTERRLWIVPNSSNATRQARLETAYALSHTLVDRLDAGLGVHLDKWGVRGALVHEMLYYGLEDWVRGLREADVLGDFLARPDVAGLPRDLWAAEGLRGLSCAASLQLPLLSVNAPRSNDRSLRALAHKLREIAGRVRPQRWRSPDVLIVSIYDNRLHKVRPMLEALRQRGLSVGVLSLATNSDTRERLEQEVGAQGIPLLRWESLLPQIRIPRLVARWGAIVASGQRAVPRFVDEVLLRSAEGGDYRDAVRRTVLAQVAHSGLRMLLIREVFDRLLVKRKRAAKRPRLIVTTRGDDTILRVMGRAASSAGVPVLDVQHGLRTGVPGTIHRDIHGVDFALYGEGAVRAYRDAEIPETRLHRVGSRDFDVLLTQRDQPIPKGVRSPFVLYSSSATNLRRRWDTTTIHADILTALDRHLGGNPGLQLVVKLHPQEFGDLTPALVRKMVHSDRVFIVKDVPNPPLYTTAIAQVSAGSTTSIEAAILGTPVVVVDRGYVSKMLQPAYDCGAIVAVPQPEGLPEALSALRPNPAAAAAVEAYYAHKVDGKSVERILAIPVVEQALR